MNPTGVVVLGATGSIGRSTLAVIRRHPGRFRVVGLTAGFRALELERLAREFDPEFVVLAGEGPGPKEWAGAWQTGEEALARLSGQHNLAPCADPPSGRGVSVAVNPARRPARACRARRFTLA